MVTVTIDGKTIEIPEGTTVLRAAQSAGIDIPTLCNHPHLTPYGGCRLCLVEVEGARTLQPSCTLPVTNNMVVKTNTKKVLDARKFVLTLIFSERNHFCPYCQVSGGDCELQNAAYNEGMTHWPLQPNWQPYPVDASHPYIILENNRCILCRRCVRACGELIGNFTLGFEERGAKSILVADTGVPLGESTCISCGSCVQVCPTGALIDRWSAYLGHEVKFDTTDTVCVGCSLGCGLKVSTRDNNLVRVDGNWDEKFNEGVICEIGRFIPGVAKKLGWFSNEDLLKRVLSLEFNRLLEYYKDAPQIDFIDEKPRKERKERADAPATKEEKDRRTASKGMERIYVNAGKRDGFYAGNLIEMLNKVVGGKRVDVGRIDLMPGYSLFDVKKSDARRVVGALKGADFMGKRIYSEIASTDKDYAKASVRRTKDKYVDAPVEAEDAYDAFEKFKRRQRRKVR